MNGSRLYRSKTDQVLGGVCGGLAEYLKIDSIWIRLLFVLLALGSGVGLMIYLLLWIIVPYAGEGDAGAADTIRDGANELGQRARQIGADLQRGFQQPNEKTVLVIGAGLILVGVYILLRNLNLPWLRWLDLDVLWPLALVALGVTLAWRHIRK